MSHDFVLGKKGIGDRKPFAVFLRHVRDDKACAVEAAEKVWEASIRDGPFRRVFHGALLAICLCWARASTGRSVSGEVRQPRVPAAKGGRSVTVRILGSAAAEGVPAIFCICDVCREARCRGGANLRRRCTYLIGDRVMVDFGPDAYSSMIAFGLDYSRLEHLLISHSHQDHWYPEDLLFRRPGFSVVGEGNHLTVHGNASVGAKLADRVSESDRYALSFREAQAFGEVDLGEGLTAVPLPANHAHEQEAFLWLVHAPDGAILFGNDTGWLPAATWDFLASQQLNAVILDSTSGRIPAREGHMGAAVVVEARDMLDKIGALAPDALVVANHFSHNGGMLHEDLEEFFSLHGIQAGYDGMTLQF